MEICIYRRRSTKWRKKKGRERNNSELFFVRFPGVTRAKPLIAARTRITTALSRAPSCVFGSRQPPPIYRIAFRFTSVFLYIYLLIFIFFSKRACTANGRATDGARARKLYSGGLLASRAHRRVSFCFRFFLYSFRRRGGYAHARSAARVTLGGLSVLPGHATRSGRAFVRFRTSLLIPFRRWKSRESFYSFFFCFFPLFFVPAANRCWFFFLKKFKNKYVRFLPPTPGSFPKKKPLLRARTWAITGTPRTR